MANTKIQDYFVAWLTLSGEVVCVPAPSDPSSLVKGLAAKLRKRSVLVHSLYQACASPCEDWPCMPDLFCLYSGLTSYGCLPQCTQLRVLNLSLNQLSSLSPLSMLTSLQNLDLSANQITTLGLSVCPLSLSLSLSVCEGYIFCPCDSCIYKLFSLSLDGVDKLESLRELNLAGNNIIE